jgi:large subunit ribosomal protein L23
MALFGRKNTSTPSVEQPKATSTGATHARARTVLVSPRVTEKATAVSEGNVYVFNVHPQATKHEVAQAVAGLYSVTVRKVHMVKVPAKQRISRYRAMRGVKAGGKKAYVYLKRGETIEVV